MTVLRCTYCKRVVEQNGQSPEAEDPESGGPRELLVYDHHRRWADLIVRVIDSPSDPRTFQEWGRLVGVSESAVRSRCRSAGVQGKPSLTLARMLRAISRKAFGAPDTLLNVSDGRTLRKMLRLGGRAGRDHVALPTDPAALLDCQQWITNPLALTELRKRLTVGRCATASRQRFALAPRV
jgi:hypothetical protein